MKRSKLTMPFKPEIMDILHKIILWGGIGALFAFVRQLVLQEPKTKRQLFSGVFVGAAVGSLIGWVLEHHYQGLPGGIAPYIAVSAILAEKIVLFILRFGSDIMDNPKKIKEILKKLLDK